MPLTKVNQDALDSTVNAVITSVATGNSTVNAVMTAGTITLSGRSVTADDDANLVLSVRVFR